jgi:hypothetical protein
MTQDISQREKLPFPKFLPRRFDEYRSEMERIYGTPEQFTVLMNENVRRGWHTQEQVNEAIRIYKLEWETAV